MFRCKGVLPTSPKHVHRCGAQCPVTPLSKLTILHVLQSHTCSKATMEMRDRVARIDGSVQVRDSTLGIEDHNRWYKRVGELEHVRNYAHSQHISKKTSIRSEETYRHIAKMKIIWTTTPRRTILRWKKLLSPTITGW